MEYFDVENSSGIIVKVPVKYKIEVMDMIKSKCYACLEKFLESINAKYK